MTHIASENRDRALSLRLAAQALSGAERELRPIPPLTRSLTDLTIEEAYQVAALRNAALGAPSVGYKLGYTSAAMREQMGVREPNYGVLFKNYEVAPEEDVSLGTLIHPLVEPELTVLMGKDLSGPGVGWEEAWDAVEAVMPSLEIVDTRYESYSFTAADNISDNSSAARFVIGEKIARSAVSNLRDVSVRLSRNGEPVDGGRGRDAMVDPVVALAWLANELARCGTCLKAGEIVMTGGLTRAYPAEPGDRFSASFDGIGAVIIQFSKEA